MNIVPVCLCDEALGTVNNPTPAFVQGGVRAGPAMALTGREGMKGGRGGAWRMRTPLPPCHGRRMGPVLPAGGRPAHAQRGTKPKRRRQRGNGGRGAGGAGGRLRGDAAGHRGGDGGGGGDVSSSSGGPRLVEPFLGPSSGRSGGQRHAQLERQEAPRLPAGQRRQPRPQRHHTGR